MGRGWLAGGAGVVMLAVSLLAVLPQVPVTVRSPALHVAVETAAAGIALLAALLAVGRFQQRRRLPDLALGGAFLLFAVTNLAFSAVPVSLAGFTLDALDTWATLAGRLLAAAMFAAAAFLPDRQVKRGPTVPTLVVCSIGVVALLGVAALAAADHVPEVGLITDPEEVPWGVSHPLVTAGQALMVALFAVAAAGFWRRAGAGDPLAGWLSAAAVLAAGARLHYALVPSLYTGTVYSGDGLRLGFYGLVLAGALREMAAYWRELARLSAAEERRRLARDLHDGLAQELAYIASRSASLARDRDDPQLERIASATRRALDESRRAIQALTEPADQPLDRTIAAAVTEVAGRHHVPAHVSLASGVQVDDAVREALLRIVREAVGNAARHAAASTIRVTLAAEGPAVVMRVGDDGCGFDTRAQPVRGRFGLTSMRERAEALEGTLTVRSRPGEGTVVEVRLPSTRAASGSAS